MGARLVSRHAIRTKALGVVVPVHNEEELLGHALDALEAAFNDIRDAHIPSHLILVFDSCRDASVEVARGWTESLPPHTVLGVSAITSNARNVGAARRRGCAAVLDHWENLSPEHVWIATTDADSRVPRTWLREQVQHHERGDDVWAGRVAVKSEGVGAETVRRWERAYDREADPIHGASLGFNGAKYVAVGGFSPLETGEDRALLHALEDSGATTYFDTSLRVLTSARRRGHAPHGFADAFHSFDSVLGAIAD
jgi:glycosyltransferase involved in cell wall biosynthesis